MTRVLLNLPRFPENLLGEHYYFKYLVRALIEESDEYWSFVAYSAGLRGRHVHDQQLKSITSSKRFESRWVNLPNTILDGVNRKKILSASMLFGSHDLVHSFNSQPMPEAKTFVLTCQDLATLRFANGNETKAQVETVKSDLLRVTNECHSVITISEFSKREIVDLLNIRPDKITVIPDGVDHTIFKPPIEQDAERARKTLLFYGLTQPYLLYMGGSAKRKNLDSLIRAHALLCQRYKVQQPLVLLGGQRLSAGAEEKLRQSPYRDLIIRLGYLPQEDVLRILQNALAVVCPSTYEGFGLPALEAMACAVPVALSNAASLPEVGGNAALYFEPTNIEEIAGTMYRMVSEPALRAGCIDEGLRQCKSFSWQNNARQTLLIYTSALQNMNKSPQLVR